MSGHTYCPVCKRKLNSINSIHVHLVKEHDLSKRQAKFFAMKLREWRERREELTSSLRLIATQKGINLAL
jgi:hypothetical protein